MTKKEQTVLEAQSKALASEVRRLKRQAKVLAQSWADAENVAKQADATVAELRAEIAELREILAEKGVVRLPDHALRAMDTKDAQQPGVRTDRFTRAAL